MLLSLLCLSSALAWGPTGHRTVGLLAQRHVSPATLAEIEGLMGAESLARAATWPDEIRSDPAWKAREPNAWRQHFINAPAGSPLDFTSATGQEPGDIFAAIGHYERILSDRSQPDEARRIALRWLVHLVGDAHQPLHSGHAEDQGGNKVTVAFFDEKTNLHKVWDEDLINHSRLSFTELADFVDTASPDTQRLWAEATAATWLEESRALMPACYETGDGWLSWDYAWRHSPTIELRLQQAGIRLAATLDRALAPARPRKRLRP